MALRPLLQHRLLALDLEGALLDAEGNLDPSAVEWIGKAWDRGVRIVLVTGLPPMAAAAVARRLDVPAHLVAYSGAVTLAPPDREIVAFHPLPPEAVRALLGSPAIRAAARVLGFPTRLVADRATAGGRPLDRLLFASPRRADDLTAEIGPDLAALLLVGEPACLRELSEEVRRGRLTGHLTTVHAVMPRVLGAVAAGVAPAGAVTALAAQLGFRRREIAAIAAEANRPLLDAAGTACSLPAGVPAAPDRSVRAGLAASECRGRLVAEFIERAVLGDGV